MARVKRVFSVAINLHLHRGKGSPSNVTHARSQQVVMEIDIDAVGQQLRTLQDQYKEKSEEYDLLYEKFNQTSQVWHPRSNVCGFPGDALRPG